MDAVARARDARAAAVADVETRPKAKTPVFRDRRLPAEGEARQADRSASREIVRETPVALPQVHSSSRKAAQGPYWVPQLCRLSICEMAAVCWVTARSVSFEASRWSVRERDSDATVVVFAAPRRNS